MFGAYVLTDRSSTLKISTLKIRQLPDADEGALPRTSKRRRRERRGI